MTRWGQVGRGPRLLLGTIAVVIVIVGLALIAYFTPLMSVRSTDIAGTKAVGRAEILHAAGVPDGTPLLQVDTREVAQRVAAIPSIESARVQREYPSSLTISVVERQPVARVIDGDTVHILDRNGVPYLRYPVKGLPGEFSALPEFVTSSPGPTDPTTLAAMKVVGGLPPKLAEQVVKVSATSPVDIELILSRNRTVVWGDSQRGDEKARTLGYLLARDASEFNVSSPEFPAYR